MDISEVDAIREMAMRDAFGTRLKVQSTDFISVITEDRPCHSACSF